MGTDNQNSQDDAQNTEKTFTQTQLNAIVEDRLKREREKYSDYDSIKEKAAKFDELDAANKTELEKAKEKAAKLQAEIDGMKKAQELKDMRTKIATENNVPIELLTGATEEECTTQATKVKELMAASGVPITVSDGGEVVNSGKLDNGKVFEQWANQRL